MKIYRVRQILRAEQLRAEALASIDTEHAEEYAEVARAMQWASRIILAAVSANVGKEQHGKNRKKT